MGLTIGSLHMMGTLTPEQQAANPYRLERDGRVSLYDNGWDNPLALYADAETLSRETGKDVLAFYCFDEDAVALALYRNGKTVAEGGIVTGRRAVSTAEEHGVDRGGIRRRRCGRRRAGAADDGRAGGCDAAD